MYKGILRRAEELKPEVINIRREIHMNPELELETFETAQKVTDLLKKLDIDTSMLVNGAGVVGLLEGSRPGKTVALRTDMDALPLQERTDVPYKSKVSGRMHACGHDGHTAMLLGTASLLSALRGELKGSVAFVFQPAEEQVKVPKRWLKTTPSRAWIGSSVST